jgi:hypothetical protein
MKKSLLIIFISTLFSFTSIFAQSIAADTCITPGGGGGGGNVVIFANYDGGVLNINVDQNIPNLKIGVCTYEPVTINLSGPFVANVTEVRYAGYVSTSNHHCPNSPGTTTIVGAPGGATTSVNFLPPATLSNPNGYGLIVCGYSCDVSSNQGGCNTADQIQEYFTTAMAGTLNSYFTQYGCWSTTPYNVSAGSNCPLSGAADTTITIFSASASAACVGVPVNFTDLSPGASTWSWTAPGSNIPSSSSQHLTGVTWSSPGSYIVTLATNDGTGNCSAVQSITVLASPNINITAVPNPICAGDTTVLNVGGAFTYQWGTGPSGSTWEVHPATSTWYDVTGTNIDGCPDTDSILVTVNPTPPTPTINYSGGTLTATPSAPFLQWYLNGNPIAGANGQNYIPTQNGTYTVSYLDANACSSSVSLPLMVSDIGSGIFEITEKLQIFPNPGTGIFQLSIPSVSNTEMVIEVIDVLGKVVYSKNVFFNSTYTLDLTGHSKGIYEVRASNGKKLMYGKIMIQ